MIKMLRQLFCRHKNVDTQGLVVYILSKKKFKQIVEYNCKDCGKTYTKINYI